MKKIFDLEESVIQRAERILKQSGNDNANGQGKVHIDPEAFIFLLEAYKKLFRQFKRLIRINDKQQQKLSKTNILLENQNKFDGLTGIYNRRFFNDALIGEWDNTLKTNSSVSLLILDIDHFKKINDTYGHPVGDEVLKLCAKTIKTRARRKTDVVARYGGEEFVVLLPDTDLTIAGKIAEYIREDIEKCRLEIDSKTVSATVSIGVATIVPDSCYKPDLLLFLADEALYRAKEEGRNLVRIGYKI